MKANITDLNKSALYSVIHIIVKFIENIKQQFAHDILYTFLINVVYSKSVHFIV